RPRVHPPRPPRPRSDCRLRRCWRWRWRRRPPTSPRQWLSGPRRSREHPLVSPPDQQGEEYGVDAGARRQERVAFRWRTRRSAAPPPPARTTSPGAATPRRGRQAPSLAGPTALRREAELSVQLAPLRRRRRPGTDDDELISVGGRRGVQ